MDALGVHPEIEIPTPKAFKTIRYIAEQPGLGFSDNIHLVLLFGVTSELPVKSETFKWTMEQVEEFKKLPSIKNKQVVVSVRAIIRPNEAYGKKRQKGDPISDNFHDYRQVIEWVVDHNREHPDKRIDAFGIGLEDTPVQNGMQQTNRSLIKLARDIFEEYGVAAETQVPVVRKTFGLK